MALLHRVLIVPSIGLDILKRAKVGYLTYGMLIRANKLESGICVMCLTRMTLFAIGYSGVIQCWARHYFLALIFGEQNCTKPNFNIVYCQNLSPNQILFLLLLVVVVPCLYLDVKDGLSRCWNT